MTQPLFGEYSIGVTGVTIFYHHPYHNQRWDFFIGRFPPYNLYGQNPLMVGLYHGGSALGNLFLTETRPDCYFTTGLETALSPFSKINLVPQTT